MELTIDQISQRDQTNDNTYLEGAKDTQERLETMQEFIFATLEENNQIPTPAIPQKVVKAVPKGLTSLWSSPFTYVSEFCAIHSRHSGQLIHAMRLQN